MSNPSPELVVAATIVGYAGLLGAVLVIVFSVARIFDEFLRPDPHFPEGEVSPAKLDELRARHPALEDVR